MDLFEAQMCFMWILQWLLWYFGTWNNDLEAAQGGRTERGAGRAVQELHPAPTALQGQWAQQDGRGLFAAFVALCWLQVGAVASAYVGGRSTVERDPRSSCRVSMQGCTR